MFTLGVARRPRTTAYHLHQFYLDKAQKSLSCFDQTVVILLKKELNSNYNLKQSTLKCFCQYFSYLAIAFSLGFSTIAELLSYYH